MLTKTDIIKSLRPMESVSDLGAMVYVRVFGRSCGFKATGTIKAFSGSNPAQRLFFVRLSLLLYLTELFDGFFNGSTSIM